LLQNVAGDETVEVNSLPASQWDCMLPLGAQESQCAPPATTNDAPPADDTTTTPADDTTTPPADDTTTPPADDTTTTTGDPLAPPSDDPTSLPPPPLPGDGTGDSTTGSGPVQTGGVF
jgi:hypothetical protein